MEYDEFPAMNTTVQVAAEGCSKGLAVGFERVRHFVEQSEERFSRFRESSELTHLNRAAGRWFAASPELFAVVSKALDMHALTGGLFDPSILNALRWAGYDRSMDEIRHAPALPPRPDFTRTAPPFGETRLDPVNCGICLPAGTQIDLGGIAKGWIAEKAANLLLQTTKACAVSAGGDMAVLGLPVGASAWEISMEDPRDPLNVIAVLQTLPGGLATSTITRRRWEQGGQDRHHIIDPRSNKPAVSPWLSVTVYSSSVILAEAFAKALLISGPAKASGLASRVDGLQYAAIEMSGEVVGNFKNMELFNVADPIL